APAIEGRPCTPRRGNTHSCGKKGRANWQFAWSSRKTAWKDSRQTASLPTPAPQFSFFQDVATQHEGSLAYPSGQLFPLSKQHKTGPEVRNPPAFLSGNFKLSRSQSRPCRQTVFEHPLKSFISSAVAKSSTVHRLATTRGAPAYINPRVSPISPSPLISLPSPDSHALSATRSALSWRL